MQRKLLVAAGFLALFAMTAPVAQASVEHPKLVVSMTTEKTGSKVPAIGWGQIQLHNRFLGTLECVNFALGTAQNETEPGKEGNSEDVRAYGEVEGWFATGFTDEIGKEASARCKTSSPLETWVSAEPRPRLTTNTATNLEGATTERLVYRGPFGGTASHREPPSLPWRQEAVAENRGGVRATWLKTGVAMTERAQVEAEEAAAGIPTERRSGCYHEPPFEEVVREPGYAAPKETELALREPPKGCIKINIISPGMALETPFAGTLEPEAVNGVKNALTPSHVEFKGGFIGTETEMPSERSSERNERALMSSLGPGYVQARNSANIKLIGYLALQLVQLK